jgi:outer membrane protein assembly factor BamD (BamD/ComL family)
VTRLVLLFVLVPAIAVAQPTRETCSARPTSDDQRTTCGAFFLDEYNREPTAPGADEHLYNAGVMYAEAHALNAAIQSFTLLRKSFPRSKHGPHALGRIAKMYADVAMIDKAAAAFEEYAKIYAGEKDAYYAMSDAIYYRRALGDDEKAIEDTKYFLKTFGTKKPADAAAAAFALTAIYEKRQDREATLKHLRDYIRQFGAKGGRDRLVIAYAKIGELQWQQSCPVKPIDGQCVRVKRKGAPVCDGARNTVEWVKRDDRAVKEALAAFASAINTYESVAGRTGGDEAGARYYYARSLLARTDVEAEASPMPAAPRGAQLANWTSEQVTARGKLDTHYENVLNVKDVATSIVAAERIARLSDDVAAAIVATAVKPSECKALAEAAAPFRENAILRYAACLTMASEAAWFDDGARSCEAALMRLAPDERPPFRELVGRPSSSSPLVVVSGP